MKAFSLLILSAIAAFAGGIEVQYPAGDITAHGYLALPEGASAEQPAPGVIVIHEWWGHNDYARSRADKLAALGYAALAVDMYGEGKSTEHPADAGGFAKEATGRAEIMKTRFLAGLKTLQAHPEVDGEKIASIGYCMGGMISLQMAALEDAPIAGAASFHGALNINFPEGEAPLKAKFLVCNGEKDNFIPASAIETFKENITSRKGDLTFISHPDAVHGFTNPGATALGEKNGINIAYNEAADKESWKALQTFLSDLFKK